MKYEKLDAMTHSVLADGKTEGFSIMVTLNELPTPEIGEALQALGVTGPLDSTIWIGEELNLKQLETLSEMEEVASISLDRQLSHPVAPRPTPRPITSAQVSQRGMSR